MAINYCSWLTGDDTTGDGTAGNPYKTITKASTGLTGGDEVRDAKSPDDSTKTGTVTWTQGSTTLTGSGTLFTTELAIGDFLKGADNEYYEIVTISSNTAAVLYKTYPSTTQAGASVIQMGVISTGAAAGFSTTIDSIAVSGSSTSSRLTISGGWDLSTQTQTGVTNKKQMHGTFNNRYGYGLQFTSGRDYITLSKINLFRYNRAVDLPAGSTYNDVSGTFSSNQYGIYLTTATYTTITTATCNSNSAYGIYLNSSSYNTITTATCNSNSNYGIALTSSSNTNTITTATCNLNSGSGIYSASSSNNTITTATCNSNSQHGIYFTASSNNTITTATCNSHSNSGIYLNNSSSNTITNLTANSNTTNAFYSDVSFNNICHKLTGTGNIALTKGSTVPNNDFPFVSIQWNNAKGEQKNYFFGGETDSNTSEARSGKCLHYDPSSATIYMGHSFFFKATDATATTLSAYIKKKNSFNGDVSADVFFLGASLFGWTDVTPTADDTYEQKTFSVTSGMVTDDGVLEMRIRVRGTAGDIFVDDLGAT